MIRIVFEIALIFLLPTIAYLSWVFVLGDTIDPDTGKRRTVRRQLDHAPLGWLMLAGAILVGITLVFFHGSEESNIERPYEPAIFKDGKIVQPGQSK